MATDLRALRKQVGQSIWLDNLSRTLIHDDILRRYIDEDGISGVTSNPSIFQKAIHSSPYYQEDLRQPADSAERLYERLVVDDLRKACDLLHPVYVETDGDDGWVSWEESPRLGQDEAATVTEAQRLRGLVRRDNLLIKVPATPAGIRAFATLIGRGVSVNVTLMFGLKHVRDVFAAYQKGMTRWVASGGDPRKVKAVASLFLSRVDTLVDQKLEAIGTSEALALRGKAAVAMAKSAYTIYQDVFHGKDFAALRSAGGRPQYLLWASTSTKNAAYPDLLYVEPLMGPQTINTLPDDTLLKLRDHGSLVARIEDDMAEARRTMAQLASLGIDMDGAVAEQLQVEGLAAFAKSFEEMLAEVARAMR
ncbi:MAG: transaldolase [Acidithiobacillus ferriphilus]|uniref:Transaldolase n=1 Tax=Acidithiobacillus ferrivorans TaxID=160808 RepID=A0A257TBK3_9PROT|nr:transaldolase [Acidithiobacillus ferriphilus]MBU2827650.1 transaldolase [Acidithiobacillus ferriphilus]MDA8152773.1 transaldolase [Acidithiobacillus sp.]OYV82140.1 MAG: transaldolase [Acidithiobacillus ferrivorans]UEP59570.1 transaldolase [Acidithiobacillus ferriphilus]